MSEQNIFFIKNRNKLIEYSIGFDSLISFLDGEGVYFNDYFNWRNIPQFSKLVKESPAAHIAAQLMGSEMRCCNNNTFYVYILITYDY